MGMPRRARSLSSARRRDLTQSPMRVKMMTNAIQPTAIPAISTSLNVSAERNGTMVPGTPPPPEEPLAETDVVVVMPKTWTGIF